MSIKIEIKKLPDSEIEIAGEIPADLFESLREKAVQNLSNEVKIDGFRPGHVPEKVLADKVGESFILEEMAELALQKHYPDIIIENKIKTIGRPQISITKIAKDNPLGFKVKTAVLPDAELPDYKKIVAKVNTLADTEKFSVEDKEIDQVIEHIQKARAVKQKSEDGKEQDVLPELNDEFAKLAGKFETMAAMREAIGKNLLEEKKLRGKEKRRVESMEKIAEETKIEIPKILIEAETEKMLGEMKANIGQMGMDWNDYLGHIKKKEDELKIEWEKESEKRVKFNLILDVLAEKEHISPDENEVAKEAERIVEYYKNFSQTVDFDRAKEYVYGALQNEKVFAFLEGIK